MVTLTIDIDGLVDGQIAEASDVSIPINDLKEALEDVLNGLQGFDKLAFNNAGELMISGLGSVTATGSFHTLAAISPTTEDNLESLVIDSRQPIYLAAKAGHSITLVHGVGNIFTMDGNDLVLSGNRIVQVMGFDFGSGQVVMVLGQGVQSGQSGTWPIKITESLIVEVNTQRVVGSFEIDSNGSLTIDGRMTIV